MPPASGAADRFGVIGGDLAGFPNGRRLDDDVVDIELQVVAGFLKGNKVPLGDGVDQNDKPFLSAFPYLAAPTSGFDSDPSNRVEPATRRCRRAADPDSGKEGAPCGAPPPPEEVLGHDTHPTQSAQASRSRSPSSRLLAVLMAVNGSDVPALGAPGVDLAGAAAGDAAASNAQRAVRGDPEQRRRYAGLGEAYLQRARETGDPSFYSRAGRSFGAALRRDARELGALIGAGTLAGLRHDFREQLRLRHRGAPGGARPGAAPDRGGRRPDRAGRYDDAGRSIQRLVDTKPGLASYSRASYLPRAERRPGRRRRRRCAWRCRPAAARPRTARTCSRCWATSSCSAAARRRRATPTGPRCAPCARYPQALVGLARVDALQRPAGPGDRPPAARHDTAAAHHQPDAAGRPRAGRRDATAQAAADLAAARAERRLYRSAGTAPDAEAVLFEAQHGDPRVAVAAGTQRLARGPERALRRRARLGAHQGRAAGRRAALGA